MVSIEVSEYKFICFTDAGKQMMEKLCDKLAKNGELSFELQKELEVESLKEWTKAVFQKGNIIVFIGAVGIAVRAIAPYIEDKTKDPGVVVIDEQGTFVIPVLSGHLGGAVDAAKKLSKLIDATPVITTATDTRGEFSVDMFAKRNDLSINSMEKAKEYTARLLKSSRGYYDIDSSFEDVISATKMPENIMTAKGNEEPFFRISPRIIEDELNLIPKCLAVGIGCKKGKEFKEIKDFLIKVFKNECLDLRAIKTLCSIDIKKEEVGIVSLSKDLQVPFETFSADVLMQQEGEFSSSDFVAGATGADNVCERSAIAYGADRLLLKKTAENGMTIAIGICKTILEN